MKDFSPLYLPGEEWYAAMPIVWADGGQIAVQKGGKWYGDLGSAASLAGLKEFQVIQNFLSTPASRDVNESQPLRTPRLRQRQGRHVHRRHLDVGRRTSPTTRR